MRTKTVEEVVAEILNKLELPITDADWLIDVVEAIQSNARRAVLQEVIELGRARIERLVKNSIKDTIREREFINEILALLDKTK